MKLTTRFAAVSCFLALSAIQPGSLPQPVQAQTPVVSALAAGSNGLITLTPARILNTRSTGKVGNASGTADPLPLNVFGKGGLPSSGISAVVLNVTVVDPEVGNEGGFVTVYPCASARPEASNINFTNGLTIPNSVVAPVDANGNICFYSYGKTHILADVSGYFATGSSLVTLTPSRVVNTRNSAKVGEVKNSCENCMGLMTDLRGKGGLPSEGIGAVVLNITVVDPEVGSEGGFLTVYPCNGAPTSSNLNFVKGQTIANSVIAPTNGGSICFKSYGKVHILADVAGYFPIDSALSTVSPARIVNTRLTTKVGNASGTAEPLVFNVLGQGGLPSVGISAVVLNVTAVDPEVGNEGGFVTVYPCASGRPEASNINFTNGQTIPNSVVTPVDANGNVCFYSYGKTHILADVAGYFRTPPGTDYSAANVLSVQAVKFTKFEALQDSGAIASQSTEDVDVQLEPGSLRFLSDEVVGLALPESANSTPSGLMAVSAAGIATDALSSGSAIVSDFFTAPNGKYYVVFNNSAELVPGGPTCKLAEVNQATGIPTCVDSTLSDIGFGNGLFNPVQFDDEGAIYYRGSSRTGETLLRKWNNGVGANLINANISIGHFHVLGDGTVLLAGSTGNTGSSWLRRLSPSGSLSTLDANVYVTFMSKFPDGNIYMGVSESSNNRVVRYIVQSGILESKPWIQGGWDTSADSYFKSSAICPTFGFGGIQEEFCYNPTSIRRVLPVGNGSIFALSGYSGGSVYKFFPTVERVASVVTTVSIVEPSSNNIMIAGTDANGTSMLTIFNAATGRETVVIDSTNEIEVYKMTYVSSTNKIMFNGLRFADNKQVIGEIDLN